MNRRRLALGCGVGLVSAAGVAGCTAVLGDFSVPPGSDDAGPDSGFVALDGSSGADTGAGGMDAGAASDGEHSADTGFGGTDSSTLFEAGSTNSPDGTAPPDSSVATNDGAAKDGAISDGTTPSNEAATSVDAEGVDSAVGVDAAVCAGTLCGASCVTLTTDAQNCNRCGHDCGTGATCSAGVCQPVTINNRALSATALATDQPADNPASTALHVFWSVSGTGGGVFQDNPTGGNVITLDSSAGSGTTAIAVHGQYVYWQVSNPGNGMFAIEQGTVGVAATQSSAGASSFIANSLEGLLYDTVGNNIYGAYNTGSGYGIYKCPAGSATPGCTSVISFGGLSAKNIATDGTANVFMADQNGGVIEAVTLGGNASSIVTSQATPTLLRVDGTHIYWANAGTKTIWRATVPGGSTAAQIASTNDAPDGLAADSVNAYWTDSAAGTVNYAPIGGSGPVTTYVTQLGSTTPMLLVRDTKFLYWNNGTSLYRVALP